MHQPVVTTSSQAENKAVELGEIHPVVDLDQELIANRAKEPLDLPFVVAARGLRDQLSRPKQRTPSAAARKRTSAALNQDRLRGHRASSSRPRSAASSRNTSSPVPHRQPTSSR